MKQVATVCLVVAGTFAMLALTVLPPDRADVGSLPEVEVIYDPALPEGSVGMKVEFLEDLIRITKAPGSPAPRIRWDRLLPDLPERIGTVLEYHPPTPPAVGDIGTTEMNGAELWCDGEGEGHPPCVVMGDPTSDNPFDHVCRLTEEECEQVFDLCLYLGVACEWVCSKKWGS